MCDRGQLADGRGPNCSFRVLELAEVERGFLARTRDPAVEEDDTADFDLRLERSHAGRQDQGLRPELDEQLDLHPHGELSSRVEDELVHVDPSAQHEHTVAVDLPDLVPTRVTVEGIDVHERVVVVRSDQVLHRDRVVDLERERVRPTRAEYERNRDGLIGREPERLPEPFFGACQEFVVAIFPHEGFSS